MKTPLDKVNSTVAKTLSAFAELQEAFSVTGRIDFVVGRTEDEPVSYKVDGEIKFNVADDPVAINLVKFHGPKK